MYNPYVDYSPPSWLHDLLNCFLDVLQMFKCIFARNQQGETVWDSVVHSLTTLTRKSDTFDPLYKILEVINRYTTCTSVHTNRNLSV